MKNNASTHILKIVKSTFLQKIPIVAQNFDCSITKTYLSQTKGINHQ